MRVLRAVARALYLVFGCLFYLIGVLFGISFLIDLFDTKKK